MSEELARKPGLYLVQFADLSEALAVEAPTPTAAIRRAVEELCMRFDDGYDESDVDQVTRVETMAKVLKA